MDDVEILAENRFTITKKLFYEGMLCVSAESYGKLAKKAVAFLGIAWLALTAVTLWNSQSLGYVVIEFVVLCLVALWIYILMPRSKAASAFKKMEAKYGGDLERITRFYEERLEVEASGYQIVVPYSEISQILRSKRLLVLVTEGKTGLLLKLDGFTRGGEAAVRELIKNAAMEENEHD
ncbi:MAG: YcxB family protein [Oscillospiraceae bacterium]|nr:YcxB family protein [Oscillospiraceae bacterium]